MPRSHPSQLTAPPESLRRRFELASTRVSIGDHPYDLLRPRSVDELISEEDFAIDERIPYWADCWPSARVLAERIAGQNGRERRALELGCGIGLVSLAAARAGFRVLATDYYAEALEFTAANAERHGLSRLDTRLVDWRKLPRDLGTFDLVVASDVLYEQPQAGWIAAALAATLSPAGLGLVSDPGRRTAEAFLIECDRRGLAASCVERVRMVDAGTRLTVSVFEIRRVKRTNAAE
jgi:predicted nicotinamide N-methyase